MLNALMSFRHFQSTLNIWKKSDFKQVRYDGLKNLCVLKKFVFQNDNKESEQGLPLETKDLYQ